MRRARILIVEDNRYTIEITQLILEEAGYVVLTTSTGEEAMVLAQQKSPDLILMDISLPQMDGRQAIKLLKEDPRTRSTPIVVFTAHAMKGDKLDHDFAACDGYIYKPFEQDSFLEQVRGYLHDSGGS